MCTTITNLRCEECKNIFPIPRKKGDKRLKGHIKHVWCFKCKKITEHKDFLYEYDVMGDFSLKESEINVLTLREEKIKAKRKRKHG